MQTTVAQKPASKKVQVLSRQEYPGNITVYTVASSKGDATYRVTFVEGRVTHCQCRGWAEYRHCYHSIQLQLQEQERAEEQQRRWQEEAERRAAYVIEFGIYG